METTIKKILLDVLSNRLSVYDAEQQIQQMITDASAGNLRDEFASQALIAVIGKLGTSSPEINSSISYKMADAMIRERQR